MDNRSPTEATAQEQMAASLQKSMYSFPGGGGYLTRFWTGTCHRGFKNIPVPYTNCSKIHTRLYTNFSKIYTRLYTNFPKMHTRPYTNCEIAKIDTVPYTKIVKFDTVPYTKIVKIDTLPDGTSPYPKYV